MSDETLSAEERKKRLRILGFVGACGDVFFIFLFWLLFPDLGDTLYILTALLAGSSIYLLWLMLVFLPKRIDRRESESTRSEKV